LHGGRASCHPATSRLAARLPLPRQRAASPSPVREQVHPMWTSAGAAPLASEARLDPAPDPW
jgi:hypothetical protein